MHRQLEGSARFVPQHIERLVAVVIVIKEILEIMVQKEVCFQENPALENKLFGGNTGDAGNAFQVCFERERESILIPMRKFPLKFQEKIYQK